MPGKTAVYLLAWVPMVAIAIVNGAIREKGYGKRVGERAAHQLSTLSAAFLFFGCTWLLSLRWPLGSTSVALTVGGVWCALTIAFEFAFGRLVLRRNWRMLLADYDLSSGRIWALLLAWLFALPWVVRWLRT